MLTRDYQKLVRQQTRWINQLKATLKEYYPRSLEAYEEMASGTALDFLQAYPTPGELKRLTKQQWQDFARSHRLNAARTAQLWDLLHSPQIAIPHHVVRARSRMMLVLVAQLQTQAAAIKTYKREIEQAFADLPSSQWAMSLPGGKSGTILPTLLAELGDAPERWTSFRHLQAQAGTTPVTQKSGKYERVQFRYACNKVMRYAINWIAMISLRSSEWARAYYERQRNLGRSHQRALRALGSKWLKIIYFMWRDAVPYDETYHLLNIARQEPTEPVFA